MSDSTFKFTDENFSNSTGSGVSLVDLYADWCGPCKIMAPTIDKLAGEYAGRVKIGKLNVDEHGAIAQKYNVQGIPFLGLFENGQLSRHAVGAMPKAQLEQALGLA